MKDDIISGQIKENESSSSLANIDESELEERMMSTPVYLQSTKYSLLA